MTNDEDKISIGVSHYQVVNEGGKPFDAVSDVAEKLGIPPRKEGEATVGVLVQGRDEEWYNIMALINAHIDLMHTSIQKTETVQAEELVDALAVIEILTKHGPMQGSFSMSAASVAHDRARLLFLRMAKKYNISIPEHLK